MNGTLERGHLERYCVIYFHFKWILLISIQKQSNVPVQNIPIYLIIKTVVDTKLNYVTSVIS